MIIIPLFRINKIWDKHDYYSGGMFTYYALLLGKLIRQYDDLMDLFYERLPLKSSYYGGPGKAFIHGPTYHLNNFILFKIAVINQHYGMDI